MRLLKYVSDEAELRWLELTGDGLAVLESCGSASGHILSSFH